MRIVSYPSSRRGFVQLLGSAFCAARLRGAAAQPPKTVRVGPAVSAGDSHGDTWVGVWAADGNLYSPSNDTQGFRHATSSNIAFNRLEGNDPLRLAGTTVNPMADYGKETEEGPDGCTWKSSGCTFLDGAFYWVVARHLYGEESADPHRRQTAQNASIVKSADYGRTWLRPARENYDLPLFPGRRFSTPYFIEFGRDTSGVDNSGQYVYAISNNGFWDNGDDLVLGRVTRSRISALNGSDWQYFTGGDGLRPPAWSSKMSEARPVLEKPGKLSGTGAVYVPSRGTYLMIGWYYLAGGAKNKGAETHTMWDFYEAPKPWGPWTPIASWDSTPRGFYSPQICPKFQTAGRLYALTAGNWTNPPDYRLHVVPLELG